MCKSQTEGASRTGLYEPNPAHTPDYAKTRQDHVMFLSLDRRCGHTPQRAGARSRARGMASQRLDDGRSEVRRYDFGGTFRRQACAQVGAVYVRLELRAEVEAEVRLLVLSHV